MVSGVGRSLVLFVLGAVASLYATRDVPNPNLGEVMLSAPIDPRREAPDDPIWHEAWVPIDQPSRNPAVASLVEAWAAVRPGMQIADVGAGGGYYTVRFAERARPAGLVWAIDVDVRMVRKLAWERTSRGLYNLIPLRVERGQLGLPQASLDLVTVIDVGLFKRCEEDPLGYVRQIARAVRPGGRWIFGGALDAHHMPNCPFLTPDEVCELALPWFERVEHRDLTLGGGWRGHVTMLRRR